MNEMFRKIEADVKLKGKVKTIIGGSAVSETWRANIGSDAFGSDAMEAVDKIKALVRSITAAAEALKQEEKKTTNEK